jgi:hypothetical protein
MNRKRDGFEYNVHNDSGLGPMTKRIKSPLPAVDQLNLNNNNDESMLLNKKKQSTYVKDDDDTVGQNGILKLTIISNLPHQVISTVLNI